MAGPWSKVAPGEPPRLPTVGFSGTRGELFGRLLSGYLLMLPTLGVYRFWLTTTKRRFYWQNTTIAGDPLEYTGNARQLLIGFLFAVAFFLPVYIAFFVLSTQAGLVSIIGYVVLLFVLWFFTGYAQYRARDFRLSRTLWRGIRFDQKGSAMAYAVRRFLWSLLVIVTAGLAYPFMSANLWRYRYANSWFGDRQVSFVGTWKTVAGPYYRAYGVVVVVGALSIFGFRATMEPLYGTAAGVSIAVLVAALAFVYWRAREASRMLSSVRLGEVVVSVRVRARTLFGQYTVFSLILGGLLFVALLVAGGIIAWLYRDYGILPSSGDFRSLAFTGWGGAAIVVGTYLLGFGTFALFAELILDFGYWKAVMRGATITNIESLSDVRAIDEDKALVGEGLADALNVGAF